MIGVFPFLFQVCLFEKLVFFFYFAGHILGSSVFHFVLIQYVDLGSKWPYMNFEHTLHGSWNILIGSLLEVPPSLLPPLALFDKAICLWLSLQLPGLYELVTFRSLPRKCISKSTGRFCNSRKVTWRKMPNTEVHIFLQDF